PAALVVVEQDAFLAQLLLEHLVFGTEVLDDLLLLAMDPAGQDDQQELPGVQDEVHQSGAADSWLPKGWDEQHRAAPSSCQSAETAQHWTFQAPRKPGIAARLSFFTIRGFVVTHSCTTEPHE